MSTSKTSLSMMLREEPELYDLHVNLLGMGDAGFWIDTILMDESILPKHETFKYDPYTREALCPLVWDEASGGFVNGKETARFFHYLVEKNIFRKVNGETIETEKRNDGIQSLEKENFPSSLVKLLDENIYNDLIHADLQFKDHFSYEVILELSDLGKGLGVKDSDCEGFVELAVAEKLGCHLPDRTTNFQHWIIFNARKQKFKIVYGIQLDALRQLITVDIARASEAAKSARAHIINAFSMCDAEGTPARSVDLHGFHGFFTPEFYPRRFALKDSLYSQRLDILTCLIDHIIKRYLTCLPPVRYCELSVSVNDLSKAWILDVLRSVQIYDPNDIEKVKAATEPLIYEAENHSSSFSQLVFNGHFPHLQVALEGPKPNARRQRNNIRLSFTYKFLAGFDRRQIKAPFPAHQDQAVNFLYITPHEAILLMMKEIEKSKKFVTGQEEEIDEEKAFGPFLKKLENLKKCGNNIPWFYEWVVGLDLFGDELGYPYCPFVARPFIDFVLRRREENNKYFGVRIDCGGNVQCANDDNPAYRSFIAHMYIVFQCLLFLQQELKYGIRIGHGTAFDHILRADLNSSKHRKSSVLMAEMRNNAYYLFKKIAFEVNITSNEYLLGQILSLKELFDMKAHITLATDDDGIWSNNQCSFVHPGHHSLLAEYCRAISISLIDSENHLKQTFETMKTFCFWDMKDEMQESFVTSVEADDSNAGPCMNTVIVHPDIIRLIHEQYNFAGSPEINLALQNYKAYPGIIDAGHHITWTDQDSKLRVAFVCICASQEHDKETLREEYNSLFNISNNSNTEFNVIYDHWQCILSKFVRCESDTKPEIELSYTESDKIFMICSAESKSEDPLKFLDEMLWFHKEMDIRAYVANIDAEKARKRIKKQIIDRADTQSGKGTLSIFTNTKKYVFSYSQYGKIMYQVNPSPSRHDKTEENFIYILCHHASAATAAVRLISDELSKICYGLETSVQPSLLPYGTSVTPSILIPSNLSVSYDSTPYGEKIQMVGCDDSIHDNLKRTHLHDDDGNTIESKRRITTK